MPASARPKARNVGKTIIATVGAGVLTVTGTAAPSVAQARPVAAQARPVAGPAVIGGTPGAPGAGDPYFPLSGNGGFHVIHYGLTLSYNPATRRMAATAVLLAQATQNLSRFDLDLSGLTITSVRIDGHAVDYHRRGQELIIAPRAVLTRGHRFTVSVRYHGVPTDVTDPDGSADGWIASGHSVFVGSEPQGAMTWFPANSHPIDKSAFDVTVTVPRGYLAVGNGDLVSLRRTRKTTTAHWRETQPMAAYLATASIAKFRTHQYRVDGLPAFVAVDPREAAAADPVLAGLPTILAWESKVFGPYPFTSTGAIVTHTPEVGYDLETQTRPLFDRAPDTSTLVHELAHQWFGDSVSLTRWKDIWLNEGFATYAEWLWSAHTGGLSTRRHFLNAYAAPKSAQVWSFPVADPGRGANIFEDPSYTRGAMVLEKLRERVGYRTFLTILRTWTHDHRYGHGTTAQFTALATKISHRDLRKLFKTWLYTAGKPAHADG